MIIEIVVEKVDYKVMVSDYKISRPRGNRLVKCTAPTLSWCLDYVFYITLRGRR